MNTRILIITSIALLFSSNCAHAQVRTMMLNERNMVEFVPWHFDDAPEPYTFPSVDVKKVLEDDKKNGKGQNRYGVKSSTNFNTKDGGEFLFSLPTF